jgi:hypothetical protein
VERTAETIGEDIEVGQQQDGTGIPVVGKQKFNVGNPYNELRGRGGVGFATDIGIPLETLRASWDEVFFLTPMAQLNRVWSMAKKSLVNLTGHDSRGIPQTLRFIQDQCLDDEELQGRRI